MEDTWAGILPKNAIIMVKSGMADSLLDSNTDSTVHSVHTETLPRSVPGPSLLIYLSDASHATTELFKKMFGAIHLDDSQWILFHPDLNLAGDSIGFILSFGRPPEELSEFAQFSQLPLFQIPEFTEISESVDAKRRAWTQLKELAKALNSS